MTLMSWSAPQQSVPAGTSGTFTGSTLDNGAARATHAMVITLAGTISAGTFQLQGSLDGQNWFPLGSATSPTSTLVTQVAVTGAPAQFVRAQVTVALVGSTAGVMVASA